MIEADVATGLTKVVPGPTYVLRLSEAKQIQKDIDEQIEAIKKAEAAAKEAAERVRSDYKNRLTNK